MARIRSIKPEFWEDETVGLLTRDARLLFIGTWNLADDSGVLRWTPAYIKASLFMYDDDIEPEHCIALMRELEEAGLIRSYTGGRANQRLAHVVNFGKHQKISHPSPTKLPPPAQLEFRSLNGSVNDSMNGSVSNSVSGSLLEGEGEHGIGSREQGAGSVEGEGESRSPAGPPPPPTTFATLETPLCPPESPASQTARDQLIAKAAKLLNRAVNLNAVELAQWRPVAQMLLRDYAETDILEILGRRIEWKARRDETYDFAFLATDVPKYIAKIRGSPLANGRTPLAAKAAKFEATLDALDALEQTNASAPDQGSAK